MANVNIKFNNKDYLLSCDDGQEESLKNLTKYLDKKYKELRDKLGNIGENKLLLITTIQLIDEYFSIDNLKIVKGKGHWITVSSQNIRSKPEKSCVATQIKSSTMCELSGDPVLR